MWMNLDLKTLYKNFMTYIGMFFGLINSVLKIKFCFYNN